MPELTSPRTESVGQIEASPAASPPAARTDATATAEPSPGIAARLNAILRLEGLIPAAFGILAILVWIGIFGLGSHVSSAPFRTYANSFAMGGADIAGFTETLARIDIVTWIFACVMATLTFTATNVAILCCVSALAGDCMRVLFGASAAREATKTETERTVVTSSEHTTTPLGVGAAVARGFLVYLILISGLLLVTGTPFSSTSQQSYISLAGTSSLFCFLVGFRPALVGSLLDRVTDAITGSRNAKEPAGTVPAKPIGAGAGGAGGAGGASVNGSPRAGG